PSSNSRGRTLRPGVGTGRRTGGAEVGFPHPDSPTNASTCPASTENEIPATMGTRRPARGNVVRRSLTSSTALMSAALPQRARIEDVPQRVSDQIDAQEQAEQRHARGGDVPPNPRL